jgi:hypothetical protein
VIASRRRTGQLEHALCLRQQTIETGACLRLYEVTAVIVAREWQHGLHADAERKGCLGGELISTLGERRDEAHLRGLAGEELGMRCMHAVHAPTYLIEDYIQPRAETIGTIA